MKRRAGRALITGASSGIGREFARVLAQEGCNLVLVSRRPLTELAEELERAYGVEVAILQQDLATDTAARRVYDYCQQQELRIDMLISNAGMLLFAEFDQIKDAEAEQILKLHVETPTLLCKYFAAEMKRRRAGQILLMSSLSAWSSYPGIMLYAATKRYLKDFGKALHYELKDYGVKVTTVCPGAVNTQLYKLSGVKRSLAVKLHIMLNPDVVARRSLRQLRRGRVCYLPGVVTKLLRLVLAVTAMNTVQWVRHHWQILGRKQRKKAS